MEALAEILLSKLFRRPVPAHCNERYRRYLNRRDVRRNLDLVRQIRGRKQVEDAQGTCYDLDTDFRGAEFPVFSRIDGAPDFRLEPERFAHLAGTLRSIAQRHRAEPDSGSPRHASGRRRVRSISRDAASASIRPSTGERAAACIPGNSKTRKNNSRN